MKRLCLALALLLANWGIPVFGAEINLFRTTLNKFIFEALAKNPQLLEAKQKINVFKEIPSQVGALEDPVIQFGLMNLPTDSFSFSQEPFTQKQITLTQKFPYPGKLGLKTKIADKNVEMVRQNYGELELQIIKGVKKSYLELCFILAAIEITKQNKKLLKQFVTIAQAKYSVGKGIQQDVIKAQVELSKIIEEIIRLNQLKETEKGKLNSFMNRLPQELLEIPHGIKKTSFKYSIDGLQKMVEENRPILKQVIAMIQRFKASKVLAEKEYFPDFKAGFRYGQRQNFSNRENPDFVSAFLGMTIPIWFETKQKKKVLEEDFRIQSARETYNKLKNQFYLDIKKATDKEKRGSRVIKLIKKGIIPQAKQSLESALAGYGVDKVDFLTLLNNQVTLFKWEIKYHRELTNYEQNLAEIEHIVGAQLFYPADNVRR